MELSIDRYSIVDHDKEMTPDIRHMVKTLHYKKSYRSMMQKKVYGLYQDNVLIGAAIFGLPCGANVKRVHGNVLELRRFILVDAAPKNSESFFLGKCLRELRKAKICDGIVTFADPLKEHTGVIYKATNFRYLGLEKFRQQVLKVKGRRKPVSMREVYQKSRVTGQYAPKAKYWQKLKKQGLAKAVLTPAKHVYTYSFTNRSSNEKSIQDS